MPALFEEGRGLGAKKHHPLVLVEEHNSRCLLSFCESFALTFQVQLLQLLDSLLRESRTTRLPELGI